MCGRYTYYTTKEIIEQYQLEPSPDLQTALTLKDNFNVAPGMLMPVIIRGEQEHMLVLMEWGLVPAWSKEAKSKFKLINARKEGLSEKPMWKRLLTSHRCIVPARGFYEWKTVDGIKQPQYITPKKGKVFSFAGLWDEWSDGSPGGQGAKLQTYTIITTTPNQEMSDIHNRMPVILNDQQAEAWLAPTDMPTDMLDDVLKPAPDGSLQIVPVSAEVNNVRNNDEKLIYPLPEDA